MANKRPKDYDPKRPLAAVAKETTRANKALHDYAFLGYRRSLRALINKYRETYSEVQDKGSVPTLSWQTISDWSSKWKWQERIKEFDNLERLEEDTEYKAAQRLWRKQRRDLLKVAFNKVVRALAEVDTSDAKYAETIRSVKEINSELRIEYGDAEVDNLDDDRVRVTVYLPDNKRDQ